jgi:putative ABC transport system substrate-binding protein
MSIPRRAFLHLAGGAAGAIALGAAPAMAKSGGLRRVGVLNPADLKGWEKRLDVLRAALRELGYVEGTTITYEQRAADNRYDRLPALAAELVALPVDVIVTAGTPGAQAAKRATPNIPIVVATISDPVATGLVPNLARPGGNITGLMFFVAELNAKRLEILKQAIPRLKTAGLLMHADNASMAPVQREVEQAARVLGVEVVRVDVRAPGEFENAFASMLGRRAEGVVIVEDSLLNVNAARLGALASARRLPSIGLAEVATGGGLLAYGVDQLDMFRRAAGYIDRIFKGAKAGDLPIERSSTFEMILNERTARQLGVTLPASFRLRADRVIE